jgi:hypothetical protein
MRKQLAKRYHYLMTGEAFNVLLVPALYFWWLAQDGWDWQTWLFRGYGALSVIIILAQGSYLWWYKLQTLRRGQLTLEPKIAQWFLTFRRFNWGMLILYLPLILIVTFVRGPIDDGDLFWGALFVGFALLEQINYYYFQLMYDNRADLQYLMTHQTLKRGFVARELAD